MQLYNFDSNSGEYLWEEAARLDPKSRLPVLPAHSTSAPPPDTADDQVAVWDTATGVWSVVEDHRGKTVYSGWESAGVVDYLGPIRDGYSLSQGDKPQSVINAELIKSIKNELADLDRWLPRAVEDIIEAEETLGMVSSEALLTTYDKLSPENQARLAKKRALRAELAALESKD